ncbi:hypothetical protein F5Y15DRAFT_399330 [Xylariaceae sp. FL0016]|nr:hypothetical protein F5Y15DRAFT_399330 [Xylariaceae sp. FL0016]
MSGLWHTPFVNCLSCWFCKFTSAFLLPRTSTDAEVVCQKQVVDLAMRTVCVEGRAVCYQVVARMSRLSAARNMGI